MGARCGIKMDELAPIVGRTSLFERIIIQVIASAVA